VDEPVRMLRFWAAVAPGVPTPNSSSPQLCLQGQVWDPSLLRWKVCPNAPRWPSWTPPVVFLHLSCSRSFQVTLQCLWSPCLTPLPPAEVNGKAYLWVEGEVYLHSR
jgi:hypothetical protein